MYVKEFDFDKVGIKCVINSLVIIFSIFNVLFFFKLKKVFLVLVSMV